MSFLLCQSRSMTLHLAINISIHPYILHPQSASLILFVSVEAGIAWYRKERSNSKQCCHKEDGFQRQLGKPDQAYFEEGCFQLSQEARVPFQHVFDQNTLCSLPKIPSRLLPEHSSYAAIRKLEYMIFCWYSRTNARSAEIAARATSQSLVTSRLLLVYFELLFTIILFARYFCSNCYLLLPFTA